MISNKALESAEGMRELASIPGKVDSEGPEKFIDFFFEALSALLDEDSRRLELRGLESALLLAEDAAFVTSDRFGEIMAGSKLKLK